MPKTTVAAIVTTMEDSANKVLLTRRNIEPFKGQWCLPGGHIDQNEPARDAIIREVKEETGLNFDAQFFGYFDEIISENNIHAVVIVFEGPGIGTLKAQEDEVTAIGWFSIAEARSLPLAFTHNKILERYIVARQIMPELRSEILAEYSVLRDELLKRVEMRDQILTFTLVVAGTFLTFGVQAVATALVLLVYPILTLFLAAIWAHSDVRIGEIAEYIRNRIEPQLVGIRWEKYISKRFVERGGRWFRRVEVSAAGVFLITQILALILAWPRLTFSLEEIILLASDILAIIATFFILPSRRKWLFPTIVSEFNTSEVSKTSDV